MILAFAGAGIGNAIRCKLGKHHFTLFMCIAVSVSSACLVYAGFLKLAELLFHISVQHEAGYICSMLFIIPGFPFITSGIDLAKLDMRSGLERLAYAIIVVMVAAVSAWLMALLLHLKPVDFLPLELSASQRILFRLLRGIRLFGHVQQPCPSSRSCRLHRRTVQHFTSGVSASWFAAAILIIVSLPLGLIFARILTDKMFRYCT